jgi:hemolysin III
LEDRHHEFSLSALLKVKPKLRGVSHGVAFFIALAGCALLARSPTQGARYLAGVTYGATLVAMFGVSGAYHWITWSTHTRRKLRRLDHSMIFLLIAGTFTPLAFADANQQGVRLLAIMWLGAMAGVVFVVLWTHAPRELRTVIYICLGVVSAPSVLRLPEALGRGWMTCLLAGVVTYFAGAFIYAKRWPNPRPHVFGYHELFHLFVIAAAAMQYAVIARLQQVL